MDRDQILGEIRGHLEGRGFDPGSVQFDTSLRADLNFDSLDTVELTLGLEKRLGIEIPDEELENIETVGDAIELIQKRLSVSA